jgi:hypothetical protein
MKPPPPPEWYREKTKHRHRPPTARRTPIQHGHLPHQQVRATITHKPQAYTNRTTQPHHNTPYNRLSFIAEDNTKIRKHNNITKKQHRTTHHGWNNTTKKIHTKENNKPQKKKQRQSKTPRMRQGPRKWDPPAYKYNLYYITPIKSINMYNQLKGLATTTNFSLDMYQRIR